MRKSLFCLMFLSILTAGCATTNESHSDWNAENVGRGMQLGGAASNGGILSPIIWGVGVVVEAVGGASAAEERRKRREQQKAKEFIDP